MPINTRPYLIQVDQYRLGDIYDAYQYETLSHLLTQVSQYIMGDI